MNEQLSINDIESALPEVDYYSPATMSKYASMGIPRIGETPKPPQAPIDIAGAQEATSGLVRPPKEAVSAWTRVGRNLISGLASGIASEADTWENMATLFSKITGVDHGTALQNLKAWSESKAGEYREGESIVDKVTRSLTAAVPTIVQLAAGTGVIGAGMKAAKLPTALKLGSTAFTGGSRLLAPEAVQAAKGLSTLAGAGKVKGLINLAEPVTFGLYEGTREAVRPGATPGSVLARTAGGVGMGGALAATHGLPQVVKQATAGAIGAGATGLEGGNAEEMLTSGLTMGVLSTMPEIQTGIGRLIKRKNAPIDNAPKTTPVSPEVEGLAASSFNTKLSELGVDPSIGELMTTHQKMSVIDLKQRFGKYIEGAPIEIDPQTREVKIKFGKHAITIPKEDPKVRTSNVKDVLQEPQKEGVATVPEEANIVKLSADEVSDLLKGNITEAEQGDRISQILSTSDKKLEKLLEVTKDKNEDIGVRRAAAQEYSKLASLMSLKQGTGFGGAEVQADIAQTIIEKRMAQKGLDPTGKVPPNIPVELLKSGILTPNEVAAVTYQLNKAGRLKGLSEIADKIGYGDVDINSVFQAYNSEAISKSLNVLKDMNLSEDQGPVIGKTGAKAQSRILASKNLVDKIRGMYPKEYRELLDKYGPEAKELNDVGKILKALPQRVLDSFPDLVPDKESIEGLRKAAIEAKKTGREQELRNEVEWDAEEYVGPDQMPFIRLKPTPKGKGIVPRPMSQTVPHDVGHWIIDRFFAKEPMAFKVGEKSYKVNYEDYKYEYEALAALIAQKLRLRAGLSPDPVFGHGIDQAMNYLKIIDRDPNIVKAMSYMNIYRYMKDLGLIRKTPKDTAAGITKNFTSELARQKWLREQADAWIEAERKEKEEYGEVPVSSREGIKQQLKESLKGKDLRGGLKQRLPEERPVEPGEVIGYGGGIKRFGIPKTSEDALDNGKLLKPEEAVRLWEEYKKVKDALDEEVAKGTKRSALVEDIVNNQLRREMVESYLGAPKNKSLTFDQIQGLIQQEAGTIKGFGAKLSKEEKSELAGLKSEQEAERGKTTEGRLHAGTEVILRPKALEKTPLFDANKRAAIIQQILAYDTSRAPKGKEGEPAPSFNRWKLQVLKDLDDRSIQNIAEYGLRVEDVKPGTWGKYDPVQGWSKVMGKVNVPGKIAKVEELTPEALKANARSSSYNYDKKIIDAVNWDLIAQWEKEGTLKKHLQPGKAGVVSFEEMQEVSGEKALEKILSPEEAQLGGIDPRALAGAMVSKIPKGKALEKFEQGYSLPKIPEEAWIGFKEGEKYDPYAISEAGVKDWFEEKLQSKANRGQPLDRSYATEKEIQMINEAMPGLRTEFLADPDMAEISNMFRGKVLSEFSKISAGTGRDSFPFSERAKEAFSKTWNSFKNARALKGTAGETEAWLGRISEEGKPGVLGPKGRKFLEEMQAVIDESPETGTLGRKFGELNDTELQNLHRIEQYAFKKFGMEATPPPKLTGVDEVVAEAGKQKDPLSDYREMLNTYVNIGDQVKSISKDLQKAIIDRDSTQDPEAKKAIIGTIADLNKKRSQLLTDGMFINRVISMKSRYGDPFQAQTESYIEMPLTKADHGIDGAIISKGDKKGSSFMVVQGPNNGPIVPGQPGHTTVARADVATRRSKGDLVSWDVPQGTNPSLEDALLNSIMERYTWRKSPIKIEKVKGVADAVFDRRNDQKYKSHEQPFTGEDTWKFLLPEDAALAKELRQKQMDALRTAVEDYEAYEKEYKEATGETLAPKAWTRSDREEFLRKAMSINEGMFDYDLERLRKSPEELGISDVTLAGKTVEYMPLIDRVGDPTQSRIPAVARVGNYAMQAEMSIQNYIAQYVAKMTDALGPYRDNPAMKSQIMRHLLKDVKGAGKDWESHDQNVIDAANGYRYVMEDIARLFKLEEKGLYRKDYATISYDMDGIWEAWAEKIRKADKLSDLPDSIMSKIAPEDWTNVSRIAKSGKTLSEMMMGNIDQKADKAFIEEKILKNNVAYESWESMPETLRAMVPKQKFITYFQHRVGDTLRPGLINEDIWDVAMKYIYTTVHDGVMSDFFLPKARNIAKLYGAAGATETYSVRGFLDQYIKQVAGFERTSPATKFLNELTKTINSWFGTSIPETGSMEGISNKYQQWLYRGALGIDTAVRNLTQSIYTIADMGPYNWVKGMSDYLVNMAKNTPEYQKFSNRMRLMEEFYGTKLEVFKKTNPSLWERLNSWDNKLTQLVLHPMRVTEHINRGIAYFAALADAAKRGLDFNTSHLVGIKSARTWAQPLEMTEAEWNATMKEYATQFAYGRVHGSPLLQGSLMKFFTPFWSFPTKSLQFVSNLGKSTFGAERWGEVPNILKGAAKGKEDVFITGDGGMSKFARFAALTGFMAMAPTLISDMLGVDVSYLWGKGIFPGQLTPMWLQGLENFHIAVLGGVGSSIPPTEKDKAKAWRDLGNMVGMLGIPQYRFGNKVTKVIDNVEKGYYTMGPNDLAAVETTFAKELVNLFGFPPVTREAKQIVWEAYGARADRLFLKQDALKEAAKHWEKGDYDGATAVIKKFYDKTGVSLSGQDVNDYIRRQNSTTAYEEAEKHVLSEMKPEWKGKLTEAQRKYLPKGPMKPRSRDFWTGIPKEMPESQQPQSLSNIIGQ